ncbi:type IV secretion system protein [Bordetella bronchiseptica]|uniref:Type IV secretion protein E n=1 Tax=Bordetella genomosp. 6 TaxID=463024 RepID=A0ABX4FDB0_9BORD|nr:MULTISPECIES: type IV secretion system protein [Bordetella]KCV59132.1 type IV secretion system protein PtlE [Bordetella bronchiseptica 99-R-0433]OZI80189.1 type IV secretion protein E [Bordetella genomosp. 6]
MPDPRTLTPGDAHDSPHAEAVVDWEASRLYRLAQSERRAWTVAWAALAVAVLALIAIATMLPLKTTIPYLIEVEKSSGAASVVTQFEPASLTPDTLMNQYWLTRYVSARERYDWHTIQHDYDYVRLLSAPAVRRDYEAGYEAPDAPDRKYGAGTTLAVKILSAIDHGKGVGTVRFVRTRRDTGGQGPAESSIWVATVAFAYDQPRALTQAQRWLNPLGFTVTSYRVDAEAGQP